MLKPSFSAAASALLITLASAGQAHAAAIYTGTFDPRGPVYGFAGTYTFAVDPNCLVTNGWKTVNGSGDCGDVVLIGGSLTLRKYDAPGPDNAVPDVEETFDFTTANDDWDETLVWGPAPGQVGGMKNYIASIFVVGNKLYGVDTPARFGAFGPFDGLQWGLRFFSGGIEDQDRGVSLLVNCIAPFTPTSAVCDGPNPNSTDFDIPLATNVTFALVPEPGSIALTVAALAAAGFAGRRRRLL